MILENSDRDDIKEPLWFRTLLLMRLWGITLRAALGQDETEILLCRAVC